MTRTMTLCIVIASVSISAQTPTSTPKTTISVTGCVAPVQRDGSLSTKPTLTPPAPESAATEANNPEPTGRFMLLDAVSVGSKPGVEATSGASAKQPRTSYTLRGHEQELAKHVGHRLEITGALMPPAASKLPAQTASTAEGIRGIQVETLKMVGTDCSPSREK
jgi:hypothetical protein